MDWLALLRDNGMPSSRYNLPHESIWEDQAEANGFVVDLDHPVFGRYRTTGMPLQMEKTPTGVHRPSPTQGQHTDDVLTEIGLGAAIERLRSSGVVA